MPVSELARNGNGHLVACGQRREAKRQCGEPAQQSPSNELPQYSGHQTKQVSKEKQDRQTAQYEPDLRSGALGD